MPALDDLPDASAAVAPVAPQMLSAPPDPNWGMPAATATVSGYYQPADAAGMMYSQQAPQAINMHG